MKYIRFIALILFSILFISCADLYKTNTNQLILHFGNSARDAGDSANPDDPNEGNQIPTNSSNTSQPTTSPPQNVFRASDIERYEVFVIPYEEAHYMDDDDEERITNFATLESFTKKRQGRYAKASKSQSSIGINYSFKGKCIIYAFGIDKDNLAAAFGQFILDLDPNENKEVEIELELQKYHILKFTYSDGHTESETISSIFGYKLPYAGEGMKWFCSSNQEYYDSGTYRNVSSDYVIYFEASPGA